MGAGVPLCRADRSGYWPGNSPLPKRDRQPRDKGSGLLWRWPVGADGCINLTNTNTLLDPKVLGEAAGVGTAILVNDFSAVAHAIPALSDESLQGMGHGTIRPGAPKLVIGVGTGLGVASLVSTRDGWCVMPGEGGHADLAPVDDEQLQVWEALRRIHGRVSAETVLSGPGLERLYSAITQGKAKKAADIAHRASQDSDPAAVETIQLFTRWLGAFAGNLALTLGAEGGVTWRGGLSPPGARSLAQWLSAPRLKKSHHSSIGCARFRALS